MPGERFLLIKASNDSLWKNVFQTAELLLVSELTQRIPVIQWGDQNAFDLYYERVSPYAVYDMIRPDFTFYPTTWRFDNITLDDSNKLKRTHRNIGDLMCSEANVVVGDINLSMKSLIPWVPLDHPAYGLSPIQIYRYLLLKYFRLKGDIDHEISRFYDVKLKSDGPVLAVHLPSDFTLDIYPQIREFHNLNMIYHPRTLNPFTRSRAVRYRRDRFQVDETTHLHETVRLLPIKSGDPYKLYHPEIRAMLGKYSISKILLITDREDIIQDYKNLYGSMLVYQDYQRIHSNNAGSSLILDSYLNARNKGIEELTDTYAAARCDFFIGYGSSHLSHAVTRLKDWSATNMKLTYWMFDKLYNFSYEFVKTGRYTPEESDGKYRLLIKRARNWMKGIKKSVLGGVGSYGD